LNNPPLQSKIWDTVVPGGGQFYDKLTAFAFSGLNRQSAAMPFNNNIIAEGKSQSGALTGRFSGDEWLKHLFCYSL
jgi:hypothetical protein